MSYKLLNFNKPNKIRSTKEHNKLNSSDCGIEETYVSNMSDEDNCRWKCKHVKGKQERIEIRRFMGGANLVIIVWKDDSIKVSMNSSMYLGFEEFAEINQIVEEAKEYLGVDN